MEMIETIEKILEENNKNETKSSILPFRLRDTIKLNAFKAAFNNLKEKRMVHFLQIDKDIKSLLEFPIEFNSYVYGNYIIRGKYFYEVIEMVSLLDMKFGIPIPF